MPNIPQPSFRIRLLRILSPVLVVSIALLCLMVWIAAWVGFVGRAQAVVDAELRDVAFVIGGADTLRFHRYQWSEPHHLDERPEQDPHFVQVFDRAGALVWQSPNAVGKASWLPDSAVPVATPYMGMIPRLMTIETGVGRDAYAASAPILDTSGGVLGTVQVTRFVPPERDYLSHLRGYLILLLVVFAALLLGVVHAAARAVLRPVEDIAAFAAEINPGDPGLRLDAGAARDRETAVLAEALNGLLDRLDRSMAAMGEFTANAAHELRTPLSILHGHVELALRRERTPEEYRATLHLLDDRLARLGRMVSALLALGRLDSSQPLPKEDVDLGILLQEAVDQATSAAGATLPAVSVELNGRAWVKGSNELLFLALVNLVDNALRYGAGPVECSVVASESLVRVAIRDHGPGIPDTDQERVFERFYRGNRHAGKAPRGAGLGLAVSRAVVERHGGRCRVEAADPGLRVEIEIPRQDGTRF